MIPPVVVRSKLSPRPAGHGPAIRLSQCPTVEVEPRLPPCTPSLACVSLSPRTALANPIMASYYPVRYPLQGGAMPAQGRVRLQKGGADAERPLLRAQRSGPSREEAQGRCGPGSSFSGTLWNESQVWRRRLGTDADNVYPFLPLDLESGIGQPDRRCGPSAALHTPLRVPPTGTESGHS